MFSLLIEAGFLPFNVHRFFKLDLYGGITVKGMP